MDITVEHNDGEDFGVVVFTPGSDDYIELSGYGNNMKLRLPVYNYEARELIERLTPVAEAPDA